MTTRDLGAVTAQLLEQHRAERRRLDTIADYMAGSNAGVYVPREATAEFRMLVDQAAFNVLPLVVNGLAQNLYVDGYRAQGPNGRPVDERNAPTWNQVWQANRMDARQAALYRPAITYGHSYAVVTPGRLAGTSTPVITPYSPRRLTALYDDPVNDEWPRYAMIVLRRFDGQRAATYSDPLAAPSFIEGGRIAIYDDWYRYELTRTPSGWQSSPEVEEHGLGRPPVVRFVDSFGDETPPGKVEPLLPAQRQLNQTTFSLLMAQQYGAFRQRWVTGMEIQTDETGNAIKPFNAAVNRMFQAESTDTRFGEFAQTDLSGYLSSRDKTLLYVSAVGQVPPHNLIVGGGISNISAEALAALESSRRHDIHEHQKCFGEGIEQMLRLCGLAMGDMAAWDDTSAEVRWRDTTPRSLGQVADALGKMATMLGIPVRALWERLPDVTDGDLARWAALADEQSVMDDLTAMLEESEAPGGPEPARPPAP